MSELDIPESWAVATIETILEINPRTHDCNDDQIVSFVPMAAVSEKSGTITVHQPRKWKDVKKGFTHFKNDDVIFAKITPCMENKKCAIAKDLESGCGAGSTEFHVFRGRGATLSHFVHSFLRADSFIRRAESNMTGSAGQKRVPSSWLCKQMFPVPPLSEQRRIVSKIESTFKRIEAIEKTVENAEKIATKMALSFLKDSARDADSQSTIADSYSERIERCKEAGQGLRKVGVSNEHGVVDLRITDEVDTAKYKLVYKGDIFYNPMRLNVGSLALYDGNRPAITSPDYIVVRPKGTECSWLLYCFLKSEIGQQEIAKKTKGSVRERVYFKSLSEIAFPELSQNLNRAAHLSFEAVKKMTGNVTTAIQQLKPLRSSILTQAFSGRLVPQDPSEGTGHQLLEQILAAKTESATTKTKSKDAAAKPKPRKTKK